MKGKNLQPRLLYPARISFRFFFFFSFFFFKEIHVLLFICLFIYDCIESSFLCKGFLQLRQVGTTLHRGAQASHHRGLSCCGAQAPDAQAQQLWLTGQLLHGMRDPPRPGLEPVSPALAGRLSTTAPPGKPPHSGLMEKLKTLQTSKS